MQLNLKILEEQHFQSFCIAQFGIQEIESCQEKFGLPQLHEELVTLLALSLDEYVLDHPYTDGQE